MSINPLENVELAKQELINYGFGKQESERVSLHFKSINDKDYVKAIRDNNSFLEQLGFSKDEVISFAQSIYSFYDLDKEYIQGKIDEIISLGVTKEEAINLCKKTRIFGTKGSSKEHMEDVISLGYSKDESLNMLKNDYEMYLSLGVSKNDWNDLFRKLSLIGFDKSELLEMIKKHEINYSELFDYENTLNNVEFASTTISKLLSSGKNKAEALNEYNKIYRSLIQEEHQRNFEESRLPDKGMSR